MLVVREIEFDWLLVDKVRLHSSVYLGFYSYTVQQLLPFIKNLKPRCCHKSILTRDRIRL